MFTFHSFQVVHFSSRIYSIFLRRGGIYPLKDHIKRKIHYIRVLNIEYPPAIALYADKCKIVILYM
jgi:hypothetical protein